jgi:hypothetical protein
MSRKIDYYTKIHVRQQEGAVVGAAVKGDAGKFGPWLMPFYFDRLLTNTVLPTLTLM